MGSTCSAPTASSSSTASTHRTRLPSVAAPVRNRYLSARLEGRVLGVARRHAQTAAPSGSSMDMVRNSRIRCRWPSGRVFAVGVCAFLSCSCAPSAETGETAGNLALLASYFSTAARVVADVNAKVAQLKPSEARNENRPAALAELAELRSSLRALSARQRILLGDIGGYLSSVRAHGFSEEEHSRWWNASIKVDLLTVADQVRVVRDHLRTTELFAGAAAATDLGKLDELLYARGVLLGKLLETPPPRTGVELDALATLQASYEMLRQELSKLIDALTTLGAR